MFGRYNVSFTRLLAITYLIWITLLYYKKNTYKITPIKGLTLKSYFHNSQTYIIMKILFFTEIKTPAFLLIRCFNQSLKLSHNTTYHTKKHIYLLLMPKLKTLYKMVFLPLNNKKQIILIIYLEMFII